MAGGFEVGDVLADKVATESGFVRFVVLNTVLALLLKGLLELFILRGRFVELVVGLTGERHVGVGFFLTGRYGMLEEVSRSNDTEMLYAIADKGIHTVFLSHTSAEDVERKFKFTFHILKMILCFLLGALSES